METSKLINAICDKLQAAETATAGDLALALIAIELSELLDILRKTTDTKK